MLALLGLFRRTASSDTAWRQVRIPEGCALRFPGRPTGSRSKANTLAGKAKVTVYRATEPTTRVTFILAVRQFGWTNRHTPDQHFDAWQEEFLANMGPAGVDQSLKQSAPLPGEAPAREILFANPQESVFTRVLLTFHRRRLYCLFAVGSTEAMARPEVRQCFQSFAVT